MRNMILRWMGVLVAGCMPWVAWGVGPTAYSQTWSAIANSELQVYLAATDPDSVVTQLTYIAVQQPTNGTIESYSHRYGVPGRENLVIYTPATNFIGTDIFRWQAADESATSAVATLTLKMVTNTPPISYSNTSLFNFNGSRKRFTPVCYHAAPDNSLQTLTFHLLEGPAMGTLEWSSTNNAWYYTPPPNFLGTERCIWFVDDGMANSNISTQHLTVTGSGISVYDQSICTFKNTPVDVQPSYGGGVGYQLTFRIATPPAQGSVSVVSNQWFYYVPPSNYVGSASFGWNVVMSNAAEIVTSLTAQCAVTMADPNTNWPTFRANSSRENLTPVTLSTNLYLQWRRDLPVPRPAWNISSTSLLQFDGSYYPVILGKTAYVGMNANDCLVALDTDTGAEKWRFYADAPIRFAPVVTTNGVFVAADDGKLYGLNPTNGAVRWVFNGAPSNRKVFGHYRMISAWPTHGGLVEQGGTLYFGTGVYTYEGAFMYAVDSVTGAEVWRNDSLSGVVGAQYHDPFRYIAEGEAAVGYLTVSADKNTLYLPMANQPARKLSRQTGSYQHIYSASQLTGRGWWVASEGVTHGGNSYADPVAVTAGSKTYVQTDAAALGVVGTVGAFAVADSKLFAVTKSGSLYCFGSVSNPVPPVYQLTNTVLETTNDVWKDAATTLLTMQPGTGGCVMVLGTGSGRALDEFLLQTPTNVHVVAVDPDTNKVAALRLKLDAAGYYGARCSALTGDPTQFGLPPYSGRYIISEDLAALGFPSVVDTAAGAAFVMRLFAVVRPYGGTVWLPTDSGQHAALASWVVAAGLDHAELTRVGNFSQLRRMGALAGAVNYNGNYSSHDIAIRAPFGVNWFASDFGPANSRATDGLATDIYTARKWDIYTGLWASQDISNSTYPPDKPITTQHKNPVYGTGEARNFTRGYGCATDQHYGRLSSVRSGVFAVYDTVSDSGLIHFPQGRPTCFGGGELVPANGMLAGRQGYCGGCSYSLASTFGLVNRPEVENWAEWRERSSRQVEDQPVRQLGVNFGAPAERMDDAGTLWIHRPRRSNNTAQFEVKINGVESCNVEVNDRKSGHGAEPYASQVPGTTNYYHHASRIVGAAEKPWVSASGILGATNIVVGLTPEALVANPCGATPVVDGVLSDTCWDGTNRVCMIGPGDNGNTGYAFWCSPVDARMYLRYDAQNLYVGGTSTNLYAANAFYWIALSDRAHVATRYQQYQVMADGTKTALSNLAFTAVVQTNGGVFTMEMAIPLTNLVAAGYDTNTLVARLTYSADASGYYVAQSRIQTAYNTPNSRMAPLTFGEPYGDMNLTRRYRLKLYFAETEGATNGQRVFSVKVQGQMVLTNLDVYVEAALSAGSGQGGANREVVKPIENVMAQDKITVELVPVVGMPQISGFELLPGGNGGGHMPVAVDRTVTVLKDAQMPFVLSAADWDGDALKYRIVSRPVHGALWSLTPQASVAYTPDTGWTGTDTMTFVANDGWTDSVPATVTLVVKEADSGLGAHWKFDETLLSGFVAVDSTGRGNDGMVGSGATWGNGAVNGAIRLDGVSAGVKVGMKLNTFTNGMSMAGWFKWNGKSGINYVISCGSLYALAVTNQSLMVYGWPAWTPWGGGAQFPVTSNEWMHVAVTYDESNMKLYRNGSLVWTRAGTGDLVSTNSWLYLGGLWNSSQAVVFPESIFGGMLDDFKVYSRALSATEVTNLSVKVTTASPPEIDAAASALPSPATLPTNVTVNVAAHDPDGGTLTYTWSKVSGPGPVVFGNLHGANTTAGFIFAGEYQLRVRIENDGGIAVESDVVLTVNAAAGNQAPVITTTKPASLVTLEDTLGMVNLTAMDADEDTLTWAIDSQATNGTAMVTGTGTNKTVSYQPAADVSGPDLFVVRVSDGRGGVDTITVNVAVTAVNDAPVVINPVPDQLALINEAYVLAIPGNTFHDVEGDSLTWAMTGLPAGLVFVEGTHSITGTPTLMGSQWVTLTADDGHGGVGTNRFQLTVGNHPPVITTPKPASLTTLEETPGSVELTANDVDGDTMTWTIQTQGALGTAVAGVTGSVVTIGYTPNTNAALPDAIDDTFVVQVSDGMGGSDTILVNVDITPVNDAPVITMSAWAVDSVLPRYLATTTVHVAASDVDGDTLAYAWSKNGGTGAVVFVSGAAADSVVCFDAADNYDLMVVVSDGHGGGATGHVGVTVSPAVRVSVPYTNTFEALAGGASVFVDGNTNGWYGYNGVLAAGTNVSYAAPNGGYVAPGATHSNVLLHADGKLELAINPVDAVAGKIYVDMAMQLNPCVFPPSVCSAGDTGYKGAVFANAESNLAVYHGVLDGSGAWVSNMTEATALSVDPTNWYRVQMVLDATEARVGADLEMFQVKINGTPVTNAMAYGDDWKSIWEGSGIPVMVSNGTWFVSATHDENRKKVTGLWFSGAGLVDDVSITGAGMSQLLRTITQVIVGNGSATPPGTFQMLDGSSTTIQYMAAAWNRIGSLISGGAPVTDAVGLASYPLVLASVTGDLTATVVFTNAMAGQVGLDTNVPVAWASQYYGVESGALCDTNLWMDWLLNQNPTSAYSPHLMVKDLQVGGTSVAVRVVVNLGGVTLPVTINGTLKLAGSTNMVDWVDVGSAAINGATFGTNGDSAVISFPAAPDAKFYRAKIGN